MTRAALRWTQPCDRGEQRLVRGGIVGHVARLEGGEDGRASLFIHGCQSLQPADDLEEFPRCASGRLAS